MRLSWERLQTVAVALGALTFAASPWALSLLIRSALGLESVDGPEYPGLYLVESSAITVRHTAALGTRVSHSECYHEFETPDWWERLAAVKPLGPNDIPASESFINPDVNHVTALEFNWWSRRIVYRGWPFLAAYYTEVGPTPIGQPSVISGAIEMPNPHRGFESSQFIGHLPYRLLPLGMLGNILTGAAVGAAASSAFIAFRARRRRARGLCPACAYPAAPGAARCPECGSSTPPKPSQMLGIAVDPPSRSGIGLL